MPLSKGAGMYANRSKYPMPDVVLTDLRMEVTTSRWERIGARLK
jgi:hypothetical protein